MEPTPKARFVAAQRRRSGGVAMVEAGILAPIFAMMMMMTVYLGGVYQMKYLSFMKARNTAWTQASVGCSGGESTAGFGSQVPSESQGGGNNPANNVDNGSQSAATSSMYITNGQDSETWNYEPTYKFNGGGPKKVTTQSWVMCNEQKHGMNIFTYLFSAIGGFL